MSDKFDRAGKVAAAYDKLRASIAEVFPFDSRDSRKDEMAAAIFELIDACDIVSQVEHGKWVLLQKEVMNAEYQRGLYDGHNGGYLGGKDEFATVLEMRGFPVIKVHGHVVNHMEWKDHAIILTVTSAN